MPKTISAGISLGVLLFASYFLWADQAKPQSSGERFQLFFKNACQYEVEISIAGTYKGDEVSPFITMKFPPETPPHPLPLITYATGGYIPTTDGTDIWMYAVTTNGRIIWEGKRGNANVKQFDFESNVGLSRERALYFRPELNLEGHGDKRFWSLLLTCDGY
jgi:hypothetical protein